MSTFNSFNSIYNICDICTENADLQCLHCQKHVCDECMDEHSKFENHEIFTEENKWNLCSQHQEQVSIFCLDCEKVICIYCTNEYFEGACKGHHVCVLDKCVNKIRSMMFEYKGLLHDGRNKIEREYKGKEEGLEYLEYFLEDEWTSSPLILSEVFVFFEMVGICKRQDVNVPICIENREENINVEPDPQMLVENIETKIETPPPVVISKVIIPSVIQKLMAKKSRQKYAAPTCLDSPSGRTRSQRSPPKRKSPKH